MAFCVLIYKIKQTNQYVQYKFHRSDDEEGMFGILELDIENGEIEEINRLDNDKNKHIRYRACVLIARSHEKEEYPDKDMWAS